MGNMDAVNRSRTTTWVTCLPLEVAGAVLQHLEKHDQNNFRLVNKASRSLMDSYVQDIQRPFQNRKWYVKETNTESEKDAQEYLAKLKFLASMWGAEAHVC